MDEVIKKMMGNSPARQRAYLSNLRSLVQSKKLEKYFQILTNFNFISAKINHPEFGVQALIEDYNLIDNAELLTCPEYDAQTVKALKLIQEALRLSAHILNQDTQQLAAQLSGRLLSFNVPKIFALLQGAKQWNDKPWLRPLTASLTPPGRHLLRTLIDHSGKVQAVAVTPDGKRVISASSGGILKVWNLVTGELLLSLIAHSDTITAVAVTPDGKRVISASSDKTLKVWDLAMGKLLLTLTSDRDSVTAVAVMSDGNRVISASCGFEGKLNIWNLTTGERLLTLSAHVGKVEAVAVTPDSKRVISVSEDQEVLKVWDLATGKLLLTFNGHSGRVQALAVISDGKRVISGDSNAVLYVWDLTTGKELFTLTGHRDEITSVAITPNGKNVISGSKDKTVKIWNLETREEKFTFTGHNDEITSVAMTPNGKQVISGSNDSTIKIWNVDNEEQEFNFSQDSNQINYSFPDKTLARTLSNILRKKILWPIDLIISLTGAFSPYKKSNQINYSFPDKTLVRTLSDILRKNLKGIIDLIISLTGAFSPCLIFKEYFVRKIINSCLVYVLLLMLFFLINKTNFLVAFLVSPLLILFSILLIITIIYCAISNILILMYLLGYLIFINIYFWSNLIFIIKNLISYRGISSLAKISTFETDISDSKDMNIQVENIKYQKRKSLLSFHQNLVNSVTIIPDGKRAVSASKDGTIKVWNLENGEEIFTIIDLSDIRTRAYFEALNPGKKRETLFIPTKMNNLVLTLALVNNSKQLLFSSCDKTIKIYHFEANKKTLILKSWSKLFYDTLRLVTYSVISIYTFHLFLFSLFSLFSLFRLLQFDLFNFVILFTLILIFSPFVLIFTFLIDSILGRLELDYTNTIITTPDGERAFSGSRDETIKVWNLKTRKQMFTLKGHSDWVTTVAVTPDGRYLISGSRDKTIKVWNLKTRKELFTLNNHEDWVNAVAITPNGKQFISGSRDKTIKIWNLETREEIFTIKGHNESVESVSVTSGGRYLISASSDSTLKVWNLESYEVIASFTGESGLTCCAVAPDGVTIVAGEASGRLHFLRLDGIEASP